MTQNHEASYADPTSVPGNPNLRSVLPDYGMPWYRVPHLLKLNALLFCCVSLSSNDASLLNGFQSKGTWRTYFGNPSCCILGALAGGIIFGMFLALPIAPWMLDRYGHKIPILVGSFITVMGSVIQAASQNDGMFMDGHVMVAFGGALCSVTLQHLSRDVVSDPATHHDWKLQHLL